MKYIVFHCNVLKFVVRVAFYDVVTHCTRSVTSPLTRSKIAHRK